MFRCCEKTTKFEKEFHCFFEIIYLLKYRVGVFFQILEAFSEYMNFNMKNKEAPD